MRTANNKNTPLFLDKKLYGVFLSAMAYHQRLLFGEVVGKLAV